MSDFVLRFLTRPGCHLCDAARPVVESEVDRAGGVINELNIDSYEALNRLYGRRIPVVLGPGEEVLVEGIIDRRELRQALRTLGRG